MNLQWFQVCMIKYLEYDHYPNKLRSHFLLSWSLISNTVFTSSRLLTFGWRRSADHGEVSFVWLQFSCEWFFMKSGNATGAVDFFSTQVRCESVVTSFWMRCPLLVVASTPVFMPVFTEEAQELLPRSSIVQVFPCVPRTSRSERMYTILRCVLTSSETRWHLIQFVSPTTLKDALLFLYYSW